MIDGQRGRTAIIRTLVMEITDHITCPHSRPMSPCYWPRLSTQSYSKAPPDELPIDAELYSTDRLLSRRLNCRNRIFITFISNSS